MNGSYPSRSKSANVFMGARVDLANKIVHLESAAVCNPSPSVIPTNQTWLGDYGDNGGHFTVYLANHAEYHFDLP